MFSSLNRKHICFYQISLFLIMLSCVFAVLYFWKLGFIDGSKGQELNQVSYTYESIKEINLSKDLLKSIEAQKYKESIFFVEDLDAKVDAITKVINHESSLNLKKSLDSLKNSIMDLISIPKKNKISEVFNNKMNSFFEYVQSNNWRTLSRMSQRVLELSNNSKSAAKNYSKIALDFEQMIHVTESSVLDDHYKKEIISRINHLQVEVKMMNTYQVKNTKTLSTLRGTQQDLIEWISHVGPEISAQQLDFQNIGKVYVFVMFLIFCLSLVVFLSSFLFNRRLDNKASDKLEGIIEKIVNENILNREKLGDDFICSENFRFFIENISNYINKRMSFGSIFQKSLPFSSILLDKNLKIEWANGQFSEDWQISSEEVTKDYMSWDYLNKLTNIGYDDPVLDALKSNIAGIYQIQVRTNQTTQAVPYEMFVSPVTYNNEKKIMLYFYPLSSLQQTINEQAKAILNPIEKSLEILKKSDHEALRSHQLKSEFEIAGIEGILDSFYEIDSNLQSRISQLTLQASKLSQKLESVELLQDDIITINAHAFKNSKGQIDELKKFKEGVINIAGAGKILNQLSHDFYDKAKSLSNLYIDKSNKLSRVLGNFEDMNKSLPQFNEIKNEIKASKNNTIEAKSRFSSTLVDLTHFKRRISNPEAVKKFQEIIDKISNEFQLFDDSLLELSKKIIQLEVSFSKTEMLLVGFQRTVFQNDSNGKEVDTSKLQSTLQEWEDSLKLRQRELHEAEGIIIESLKVIYESFKKGLRFQSDISTLIEKDSMMNQENSKESQHTNL